MKRIGILTGGGDAPGLNAVIRAAAKTAMYEYGCEVIGIRDGYDGFIDENGVIPSASRMCAASCRAVVRSWARLIGAIPRRVDPDSDAVITTRGMGISFGDK